MYEQDAPIFTVMLRIPSELGGGGGGGEKKKKKRAYTY